MGTSKLLPFGQLLLILVTLSQARAEETDLSFVLCDDYQANFAQMVNPGNVHLITRGADSDLVETLQSLKFGEDLALTLSRHNDNYMKAICGKRSPASQKIKDSKTACDHTCKEVIKKDQNSLNACLYVCEKLADRRHTLLTGAHRYDEKKKMELQDCKTALASIHQKLATTSGPSSNTSTTLKDILKAVTDYYAAPGRSQSAGPTNN